MILKKAFKNSKKFLPLLAGLSLISSTFTACQKNQAQASNETPIQDVQSVSIPSAKELYTQEDDSNLDNSVINLDLTKMSPTMIYSTVFAMLVMPEDYENMNIKIAGNFQVFVNELTDEKYFALIVPDATQCCQQGIEFIWPGEHSYPEDYPEIGQEIEITGRYKITENEDGITYTYLRLNDLKILES